MMANPDGFFFLNIVRGAVAALVREAGERPPGWRGEEVRSAPVLAGVPSTQFPRRRPRTRRFASPPVIADAVSSLPIIGGAGLGDGVEPGDFFGLQPRPRRGLSVVRFLSLQHIVFHMLQDLPGAPLGREPPGPSGEPLLQAPRAHKVTFYSFADPSHRRRRRR